MKVRFSTRNLVIWTACAAGVLALAQVTGMVVAIATFCVLLYAAVLYESGLESARIESDLVRTFFSDVDGGNDTSKESKLEQPYVGPRPKRQKFGPLLYVLFCGAAGVFFGIMLHQPSVVASCTVPFSGFPIGGLIYRYRSRHWPIDPFASQRMIVYVAVVTAVVLGPPIISQSTFGMLMGLGAATFVSLGILISGRRRDLMAT